MNMEVKNTASAKPAQIDGKKVIHFFGDVKKEFKNIDWTHKDELTVYTKVVVGATFLFGMFIYLIDLVIQGSLSGMGLFMKLFGG
ncbi:MAG: preprotein translocase subunit SecE [Chlamydiales bacterium]|nr:preprotein translocase subunit SecE [Chlamydiales bacterium]